jgi:AAA domain, putative AbiEii toxin, Type IV TA system
MSSTPGWTPESGERLSANCVARVQAANRRAIHQGRAAAPRYPRAVYKSLQIENFRGLRRLELSRLAPITILTGRNNVGKTAVLEALFLHACGPRAAQQFLTTLRPNRSGPVINIEVSRLSSPWETAFHNKDIKQAIRLTAQIDHEKITVELSTPRQSSTHQVSPTLQAESPVSGLTSGAVPGFSYAMRVAIDSQSNGSKKKSHRGFTQTISAQPDTAFVDAGGQQRFGLTLDLQPEDDSQDSEPLVFAYLLGAQQRSPQAELAQRYTNVRLGGFDKNFLSAMRAVEPTLETVEILATGTPTLYFTLRGGPTLPIAAMGEGMAAIANYAAAIFEAPSGGLVIIDEVENGIHYSALEKVWTQIGRAVKDTGTQVVASTHSYECVRAAYRVFRNDPDALKLIRLQPGDDSPAAIKALDYDLESLEGALDMNLDLR